MKKFAMGVALAVMAMGIQSCGEEDPANAKDMLGSAKGLADQAAGDLGALADKAKNSLGDLTKMAGSMSPEELKTKMGDVVSSITKSFDTIKDKATATDVVEKLKGSLEGLGSLKTMLADKMPDMTALKDAAASLKSKFAGKTDILEALKPMLDKITNLVGG